MGRKMNFFLSALLALLFTILLSTCSYASISKGYIDYALDLYKNGEIIDFYDVSNLDSQRIVNALNSVLEADGLDINDYNLTILAPKTVEGPTSISSYLVFIVNNNGTSNNLSFLKMGINSSYPNYLTISPENIVYGLWYNTQYNIVKLSNGNNPVKLNVTNTKNDSSIFNFNEALSVCTSQYFINKSPIGSVYINYPNYNSSTYPMNLINNATSFNEWAGIIHPDIPVEPEEPEEPSGDEGGGITGGNTGNITNPSGDTTGKVDLSGIESGIGNINQNLDKTNEKLDGISGEIGKLNQNLTTVPTLSGENITSSEITDALDFEFAEDPYANFWLELTTGLSGALTNDVRSIDVQFRDKTYKIALDNFAIQIPTFLKSFLAILSTVLIFWKMIKYWKIIIDNITSGNMDEVLEMNEEERYY